MCKKAKLQARIKPTALCSVIDKENLIEFPLDFLHYLYNYYMVCALLSHAYHVTHHVTSCDMTLWIPVMWLWYLWHDTFLYFLLCSKSKINIPFTITIPWDKITPRGHTLPNISHYYCYNVTYLLYFSLPFRVAHLCIYTLGAWLPQHVLFAPTERGKREFCCD